MSDRDMEQAIPLLPKRATPDSLPDYGSTKGGSDGGDGAERRRTVEGNIPGDEDERGEVIVSHALEAGGAADAVDTDNDQEKGDEDRFRRWQKALYRSRLLALLLTVGALTGAAMLLSALEEKGVIHWFGSWGAAPPAHAMTDLGPMIGTMSMAWTTEGVTAPVGQFLGIPFAQTPERYEVAKLTTHQWTGLVETGRKKRLLSALFPHRGFARLQRPRSFRSIPPTCPQPRQSRAQSEDCLTLSLWAPKEPLAHAQSKTPGPKVQESLVPVMVYLHGGRLEFSARSQDLEESGIFWSNLAASTNQVVVYVQFRQGALGFLPTAKASNTSGTGGLNGAHDVIVALQWIQQHIYSFGGDRDRVTLFGHSSGGSLVCWLGASPLAAGLFSGSVIQSGPCAGVKSLLSQEFGQAISRKYMASLNATTVEDLKALPVQDLLSSWLDLRVESPLDPNSTAPVYWDATLAFIDGWVLEDWPMNVYAAGQANMQRVIVGVNSMDGILPMHSNNIDSIMTPDLQPGVSDQVHIPTRETYTSMLRNWVNATFAAYAAVGDLDLEAIATRALELYPLENIETDFQAMEQFILMDNDAIWRCPSMQLAQTLSAVAETHTYLFAAGPFHTSSLIDFGFPLAPPGASYGWASHGQENHALMNTLCSAKTPRLSQEDLRRCFDAAPDQWRLSRAMGQYWMAISGPPGVLESEDGHGKLEWPALNSSMTFQDIPVVVFDLPQVQSVQTGLHAAQCEYWNQLHLGTL